MRALLAAIAVVTLVFLALPVFVVLPLSFSASPYLEFPPSGLSLQWYARYFENPKWSGATLLSVQIALGVTALSLLLGVPAAFSLVRAEFRSPSRADSTQWALAPQRGNGEAALHPHV